MALFNYRHGFQYLHNPMGSLEASKAQLTLVSGSLPYSSWYGALEKI